MIKGVDISTPSFYISAPIGAEISNKEVKFTFIYDISTPISAEI
jgi:hypothetical protein